MKIAPFRASVALAYAPAVLAQGLRQATGGPEATPVPWYPSPPPEVSECTASLITTLCDYKSPGPRWAVASSGRAHCWEYCNKNQPCDFVIFAAGNPYTGTGTCWLYPGETFDESAGSTGCEFLSVYDKPDCGDATPTAGACEATASPSAVATVCDYPTPDDDCWGSCTASGGAPDCLSQCVEADSCSYAVFNPRNEGNSPYNSGTCWMYPSGTFDANKAKTCSGAPEQFVYENPCPKPPKPSSSSSSTSTTSSPSSTGGSSPSSDGSSSASPTGSSRGAEAEEARDGGDASADDSNGSALTGVSLSGLLGVGVAALMWQGLR